MHENLATSPRPERNEQAIGFRSLRNREYRAAVVG
jgi:hypothetical protein